MPILDPLEVLYRYPVSEMFDTDNPPNPEKYSFTQIVKNPIVCGDRSFFQGKCSAQTWFDKYYRIYTSKQTSFGPSLLNPSSTIEIMVNMRKVWNLLNAKSVASGQIKTFITEYFYTTKSHLKSTRSLIGATVATSGLGLDVELKGELEKATHNEKSETSGYSQIFERTLEGGRNYFYWEQLIVLEFFFAGHPVLLDHRGINEQNPNVPRPPIQVGVLVPELVKEVSNN